MTAPGGGFPGGGGNPGGGGFPGGMEDGNTDKSEDSEKGIKAGNAITVPGIASVKMPCAMNAPVVVLGSTSASVTKASSAAGTADSNGVIRA